MTLDNRVIVVTGASKGLGEAIAKYFGTLGCRVACVARNSERLERTAKAVHDAGGAAVAIPQDVTRQQDTESIVAQTVEAFGTVDVLFNCVGTLGPKMDLLEYLDEADWDESLAVNLKSVFLMCRSVVPIMKQQRRGKIVNFTTHIDDRVERGVSPYYAAKAGVTYLTRQLACELKPFNVQVNCINPGGLKTDMTTFWEQYPDKEAMSRIGKTQYVPFDDRLRDMQELMPTLRFMASGDSDPITGAYFTISSKVEPMYLSL